MTGGTEFDDEVKGRDEPDDVLVLGAGDGPRWYSRLSRSISEHRGVIRAGLWVAGAVVVGLAVSSRLLPTTKVAAPPAPTPADTAAPDYAQEMPIASVLALANHDGPLNDYVRQSSAAGPCTLVPVGHSPTRAIAEAVRRAMPGFTALDVGRTLDQFTGLCSVELRARHNDAILTLSVAAPAPRTGAAPAYTLVQTGFITSSGVTTKYVSAVTTDGWTILVGATGADADLPMVQDLLELSEQRSLTW